MDSDEPSIAGMIFVHFAMLSMMAIGGGVIVLAPDVQRFVVDVNHWLDKDTFLAAYTIAQAAPGPNMLYVTLVGWFAAGWLGALAATIAIVVPPAILTLVALRSSDHPRARSLGDALRAAFLPFSVGLVMATGWSLAQAAHQGWGSALLTGFTVAVFLWRKFNPLWLMAIGAIVGMLGWF